MHHVRAITDQAVSALVLAVLSAVLYAAVYVVQFAIAHGSIAPASIALYAIATSGLFVLYARALRISRTQPAAPASRAALIGGPVVVSLALSLAPPTLSIDVFSYLAEGYQVNQGENPYRTPVLSVAATPYGRELEAHGWLPVHGISAYGPLWLRLEAAAQRGARDVATQVRLLKVPVALSGILSAWLIWAILGVTAPGQQLFGTVLYLWNPLVILEFAGDGHNDAPMLMLLLLAVLLLVKNREASAAASALGTAFVKISALFAAGPLALLALRQPGDYFRRVVKMAIACALAAGVGALLYGDLWLGSESFAGIRVRATAGMTPSTAGGLFWWLSRAYPEAWFARAVTALLNGSLIAYAAFASWRVRDVPSALRACASISIAMLVLGTAYWPWYVAMPVALCALSPVSVLPKAAFVLSLFGRFAAPVDYLRISGLMDWPTETIVTTLIGLWIPGAIVAALAIDHSRRASSQYPGLAAHSSAP